MLTRKRNFALLFSIGFTLKTDPINVLKVEVKTKLKVCYQDSIFILAVNVEAQVLVSCASTSQARPKCYRLIRFQPMLSRTRVTASESEDGSTPEAP